MGLGLALSDGGLGCLGLGACKPINAKWFLCSRGPQPQRQEPWVFERLEEMGAGMEVKVFLWDRGMHAFGAQIFQSRAG